MHPVFKLLARLLGTAVGLRRLRIAHVYTVRGLRRGRPSQHDVAPTGQSHSTSRPRCAGPRPHCVARREVCSDRRPPFLPRARFWTRMTYPHRHPSFTRYPVGLHAPPSLQMDASQLTGWALIVLNTGLQITKCTLRKRSVHLHLRGVNSSALSSSVERAWEMSARRCVSRR